MKGLVWKSMLEEWKTSRYNGDTGRKIYNTMPSVNLCPTNWIREDVIFLSEYGPFPAYLKRFHVSDSDQFSCGGTGKAIHCTTEFSLIMSWRMENASVKLLTRMAEKSRH
ncbi:hypothetical protein AVEN_22215-1 [Araneus ventricosus]|uniref:Uncharacterized protein n=1 Tax=Araneus ventricosus TaxID=182803 RepID=A0A4Y2W930_ARAVE|nr:hypothetical protein AVEN_22215-1 [Araneus ventricosus]